MTSIRQKFSCLALLLTAGWAGHAQTPLAKPLADFDKLVSQLKAGSLVGEPIRAGETAVIPFARLHFSVGGGELLAGFAGGMSGKTVSLGVVIVEGDDVRAELFPEEPEKPSLLQQVMQGILDRKLLFMVNGLNIGNAPGNVQDLAPLLKEMMTGQTTVMVQALNLGNLKPPSGGSPAAPPNASLDQLNKLFDAKKYAEALSVADTLMAKDAKNAELHAWRGRILRNLGQIDAAIAEFQTAIAIQPSEAASSYLAEAVKAKSK